MADDLRNPYGLLGLPFGATREAASKAFARKARGLRREADGTQVLTQLTWALNQIQEAIKDPTTALHVYRVPADPSSLDPHLPGVMNPPPERLERRTGPSDGESAALLDAARADAHRAVLAEIATQVELPSR